MGIDFTAYSNIRTEPLPDNYRNKNGQLEIECYNIYEQNPDFITICETTYTIYFKTSDTIRINTNRSYSGFAEFCNEIHKLSDESLDITYYGTIMSSDYCGEILNTLEKARKYFVSSDWSPDVKKYNFTTRFTEDVEIEDKDNIHEDSWFFREFYTAVHLAKNNGILRCW